MRIILALILSILINLNDSSKSPTNNVNFNLKNVFQLLKGSVLLEENEDVEPISSQELENLLRNFPVLVNDTICTQSESCARNWINNYNDLLERINQRGSYLEYKFETDINEENERELIDYAPMSNRFLELTKPTASQFLENCDFWAPDLRRMLFFAAQGIIFKDEKDVIEFSELSSKLESIYATAKVCETESNCLTLDPELSSLLKDSRDYEKLLWAWKGWHDQTGPKMRHIYARTVEINNKASKENGYKDLSERWIEDFEDDEFEAKYDELFLRIKPLYSQLHAYVRRKLKGVYGLNYPENHDPKLIPAHLLGNMWAQSWDNIFDIVVPFPNEEQINFTKVLVNNQYTPIKMFQASEEFFMSLGLFEMAPRFWKFSDIVKPAGRNFQCHASATDFFTGDDFRIKMCTSVDDENFYTIHHEMGHIEYYMAYKDQPAIFRSGANSAFHEAIGDTIALSVQTPKHFKEINIIDDDTMTKEQEINFLMLVALKKLAFLPFGYLMDKWRWDVFRGNVNESNYNQKWWQMRNKFQGLESPVERTENDFDPGAKYHIASYTPYARYFISHFLQFQFYKSLCKHADHQGPLYKCDFYRSEKAGFFLKKMLEMGASKHWSIALNTLTGETEVTADAIFEYFEPLQDWLQEENSKFLDDIPGF
ncbi:angiotensin-converting enzyme-like [Brachionus plicatilis]|uniref:Angiotensin-converting enzyme n=1 Tax=Brachionus plicatilis TaxID=10195 RepID=A0A3M7QU16_BRAPC|nr:angiotensin-converting enzyme-like [Brachionus plicatilis]